jgi:hypothetical protein
MHPSLSMTLASLDEYIAYLTEIRSQLAQGGRAKPSQETVKHVPRTRSRSRRTIKVKNKTSTDGSARKNEVAQFIKTHGPSKRADIRSGTKMPVGTLAYVLNDKERFTRLPDGRWDIKAA